MSTLLIVLAIWFVVSVVLGMAVGKVLPGNGMELPPPTAESIWSARIARDRERAEIERITGVRITGDGTIARPIRINEVAHD